MNTKSPLSFDDLEDDISLVATKRAPADVSKAAPDVFVEKCPKCNGTGRYYGLSGYGASCFKCNGTGRLSFKKPAAEREAARIAAANRKERAKERNLADFEAANPDIAAWWTGSTFEFAVSLREFVIKNGYLSEKQEAAARKCVEKHQAFIAARANKEIAKSVALAAAPAVDITPILTAFANARNNGVNSPRLRLAGSEGEKLEFSRAPDHGKNAGAVYVKAGETYLGKIMGGKFERSRDCTDTLESVVVGACADPEQAAVAFGKRFGVCSCCGRTLTNEVSIDLGIGPICRAKYF